ncbi:hypothetical protein GWI33_007894 [Rhynchophorus ferrugineus]|uniref:Uncharacterized protein n=1 Tax=Rhynchophorus ferrugineus TaxID=354439 RepID=A0A834IH14_RHYFE|nr:hypothetical protein GWI33_007894 [Rhynchophorus ferrugineus]
MSTEDGERSGRPKEKGNPERYCKENKFTSVSHPNRQKTPLWASATLCNIPPPHTHTRHLSSPYQPTSPSVAHKTGIPPGQPPFIIVQTKERRKKTSNVLSKHQFMIKYYFWQSSGIFIQIAFINPHIPYTSRASSSATLPPPFPRPRSSIASPFYVAFE